MIWKKNKTLVSVNFHAISHWLDINEYSKRVYNLNYVFINSPFKNSRTDHVY